MTHDELLKNIKEAVETSETSELFNQANGWVEGAKALLAIIKLHEPFGPLCYACTCQEDEHIVTWPCQTIRVIKRELYHARVN